MKRFVSYELTKKSLKFVVFYYVNFQPGRLSEGVPACQLSLFVVVKQCLLVFGSYCLTGVVGLGRFC